MTGNGLQFPIRVTVTLRGCRHCQLLREPISKTAPPKSECPRGPTSLAPGTVYANPRFVRKNIKNHKMLL